MILFQKHHVKPILDGTKTQTRRIWVRPRAKVGSIHQAKLNYRKSGFFARLKILEVRTEWLLSITEEDARAEGYPSRDAYIEEFYRINKVAPRGDYWVHVVRFEVVR